MTGKQRPHLGTLSVLLASAMLALGACEASAPHSAPITPRDGSDPTSPATSAVASSAPLVAPSEPAIEPLPPPTPAEAVVLVEPVYKLGESSPLADVEAFNRGGLGPLAAELPAAPGHPHPRVVLEVPSARGGQTAKAIEKAVRAGFWQGAVSCYRLDACRNDELELDTTVQLQINRGGRVTSARIVGTEAKGDPKVMPKDAPACLARKMQNLDLPGGKGGTTARVRVRVWPGDDPLAPPVDQIVPGPGAVDPTEAGAAASAVLPALEACYLEARRYAPELWGRLAVRLHIDEAGAVDEAFEVESAFPDEHLRRCALGALRKAVFPPPTGGDLRLVVPLRFLPQGFAPLTN